MIDHVAGLLLHATVNVPYYARVKAKYYDARYEPFRRCVVKRESEGIPWVVNHDGSNSAGLYQFMPFWQPYLVKHLRLTQYRNVAIQHWTVRVQDASFWYVLDAPHHGRGWVNWAGGRWDCTHLLPRGTQ